MMTRAIRGMGFAALVTALWVAVAGLAPAQEVQAAPDMPAETTRDTTRGEVTNLPLPRYVTLKTAEGNARRGPGRTHRIDWVFTRIGMPLRITAEFEHWRRVEDSEGIGGWVHYALLSGTRSVLVAQDMVTLHTLPEDGATEVLYAERDVIAHLLECHPDWCKLEIEGTRGWARKTALWGVDAGEVIE